jgi:GT2 family glycosyltransferase
MKVVVLSALGNTHARRCVGSLLETTLVANFDLYLVRERGFRERTLNFALSIGGTDDDILFVGDDIEFTPGWYEALMTNYDRADILGLSMLYPGTTKVQDRGYDLVQVDERITLEAKDRGKARNEIAPIDFRTCDSLCGCFMLVKDHVFDLVPRFSEEGQNRWGEFIFMIQAQQRGATVAVIDHFLYHDGESTKSNPDKSLSSISYQMERGIWKNIVRHYVNQDDIRIRICRVLEESFQAKLQETTRRVLFYGIGTVTEFILSKVKPEAGRVAFCTGLPEEVGSEFYGQKVHSVDEVTFAEFDWVLITPLYIGEKLYRKMVLPRIRPGFTGAISVVEMEVSGNEQVYRCRDISPYASTPFRGRE